MKNNKGITLTIVIMTVMLLTIIAALAVNYGIDTYQRSKVVEFETYMKIIQKKVDLILEEGLDYTTLGAELTQEQLNKLQTIISSNNSIYTQDLNTAKLRYFSASDIKTIFEIQDVTDEVVVNFANRDVISLNGVDKDGVMHYVDYTIH